MALSTWTADDATFVGFDGVWKVCAIGAGGRLGGVWEARIEGGCPVSEGACACHVGMFTGTHLRSQKHAHEASRSLIHGNFMSWPLVVLWAVISMPLQISISLLLYIILMRNLDALVHYTRAS